MKMKRKLTYDSNVPCENASLVTKSCGDTDYEPTHFLRCHSRKDDPSDVRTQVWQCLFEPNNDEPQKTTEIVATCGANHVCFINVRTAEVKGKFSSKDLKEMFYSIAWTTLLVESGEPPQINVLAAAGARSTLHLIHPEGGVAFFKHQITRSTKESVSSLLFHPRHCSILFCAMSSGQVLVWDIGTPAPPQYDVQLTELLKLEVNSEIFNLVYSSHDNMLLVASNTGVSGWLLTREVLSGAPPTAAVKFQFPRKKVINSEPQLVDSLEVVGDSMIATKCALHGAIYIWHLKTTLESAGDLVVRPTHVLRWSDTDNYFMNMGCHAGLLACGDDRGAVWLYNLKEALLNTGYQNRVEPSAILQWPDITDSYVDRNRKLRLGMYDIVVDKVAVSWNGKYLVSVTNNNMVCIWKRAKKS